MASPPAALETFAPLAVFLAVFLSVVAGGPRARDLRGRPRRNGTGPWLDCALFAQWQASPRAVEFGFAPGDSEIVFERIDVETRDARFTLFARHVLGEFYRLPPDGAASVNETTEADGPAGAARENAPSTHATPTPSP
jgi:hypothetical protein